jgi:hypothetical protein
MSLFKSSFMLCMLLLMSACSHSVQKAEFDLHKLILQTPDRLAIQLKLPRFVIDKTGVVHVAAASFNGEDSERLEYFQVEQHNLSFKSSFPWYRVSLHQLLEYDDTIWALVSGRRNKQQKFRQIYLVDLKNNANVRQLSETAFHHLNPHAITFTYNDKSLLCWSNEEWAAKESRILVSCHRDHKTFSLQRFTQRNTLMRRPTIAWYQDQLVVAWDQWKVARKPALTDPDFDIVSARLRLFKNKLAVVKSPNVLIAGEALTAAPQLVAANGQLLLAFHSNHRHGLLKHWELVQINGEELHWMDVPERQLHTHRNEESQGNEFPILALPSAPQYSQWAMLTRPSHGATLIVANESQLKEWELDQDGWGARDLIGQISWLGPKQLLIARRGHKQAILEWITLAEKDFKQSNSWHWRKGSNHLPAPVALHRPLIFNANDKNVYYGDVHTHSGFSDGTGPNDEIYARLYQRGLHFSVLTDHDNIVGSRLFPQQHEENQIVTDWFDAISDFTTLQAFEWTTPPLPRGHGHKNIYFENTSVNPVFSFKGDEKDVPALYRSMENSKSFAVPHHTAWTGIDWQVQQEKFEPQFEIASVHGVYETSDGNPFKTLGEMTGTYARDGLKLNKKMGFIAGSDAHGLLEHHGNGRAIDPWGHGLTGVRMGKLTRSVLWHALYDKKTWATTGTPITIENKIVKKAGLESFIFSVVAPDVITNIELVIDGGRIILNYPIPPDSEQKAYQGEWPIAAYLLQDQHSFYLRVLTKGQKLAGEGAFSSPIWVIK